MKRRTFLTAAASAPFILSCQTLGRSVPGPSEQVNVGLIGLGGRCRWLTETCLGIPEMRIVAVCDCFKPRVDACLKSMKDQGWRGYTDFREMIEQENLDAVMVETTTHARAWVATWAMAMGVDVYIEKPMCLTIAEGREMVRLARKYKTVTQVGTQQRSMPLNNWASDVVKDGRLGKVNRVLAPNFIGPVTWPGKDPQPVPPGSEAGWWDTWTNQAPMRPYHEELHKGWATWRAYDGGGRSFGVTGWGAHSYDQVQRGLGTDDTGPVEIVLEEAVADQPSGEHKPRDPEPRETGQAYYAMTKSISGPRGRVTMRYESGTELALHLDADWGPGLGCIFECEKGTLEVNRDKIWAEPDLLAQFDGRPNPLDVRESRPHVENWLACIKSRETCNADIEFGHRANTLCCLVNIARDLGEIGKPLQWDPRREQFRNSDTANEMLAREKREGFELPA
jgi:predicted dehydrogenase